MRRTVLQLRIEFYAIEIQTYVMNLYLFPYSIDVNHWLSRLGRYLGRIHFKLKPIEEFPSKEFYFTHLTQNLGDEDFYFNRKAEIEAEVYSHYALLKEERRPFPTFEVFNQVMTDVMSSLAGILATTSDQMLRDRVRKFAKENICIAIER